MKNIFMLILILSVPGCTVDENGLVPPFDSPQMWESHHKIGRDSIAVIKHLFGEWRWVYNACCPEGILTGKNTETENLFVSFHRDMTLEVVKNGEHITTADWSISLVDGDLYELDVIPSVTQLHGRILFKDEYILFSNSYIDGADNYFKKNDLGKSPGS